MNTFKSNFSALRRFCRLFLFFAILCFPSLTFAQDHSDWGKQIRKEYAEALAKIKAGQEDANVNNKAVIVINQNYPGSGPSEFTVEYFFDIKDHEMYEGEQERHLYFMRVKERWAAIPDMFEYLFDKKGNLRFYFSKTYDVDEDRYIEHRDYFMGESQPFLEIIDGKSYNEPPTDTWMFVQRFLMGYTSVFYNLPPYYEH